MTVISSKKHTSAASVGLFLLSCFVLAGGIAWLVVLMNRDAVLKDNIKKITRDIGVVETANAEAKDGVLRMLTSEYLKDFARMREFVQEKNPGYIEVAKTWAEVASRY